MNELFSILGQIVSILDNHFEREFDAEEALRDINKIMPSFYRVAQNMDRKVSREFVEKQAWGMSRGAYPGGLLSSDIANGFCEMLAELGYEVEEEEGK